MSGQFHLTSTEKRESLFLNLESSCWTGDLFKNFIKRNFFVVDVFLTSRSSPLLKWNFISFFNKKGHDETPLLCTYMCEMNILAWLCISISRLNHWRISPVLNALNRDFFPLFSGFLIAYFVTATSSRLYQCLRELYYHDSSEFWNSAMEIEKTRIHEFLHHEKIDKHLTRLETVTKMKRETVTLLKQASTLHFSIIKEVSHVLFLKVEQHLFLLWSIMNVKKHI